MNYNVWFLSLSLISIYDISKPICSVNLSMYIMSFYLNYFHNEFIEMHKIFAKQLCQRYFMKPLTCIKVQINPALAAPTTKPVNFVLISPGLTRPGIININGSPDPIATSSVGTAHTLHTCLQLQKGYKNFNFPINHWVVAFCGIIMRSPSNTNNFFYFFLG